MPRLNSHHILLLSGWYYPDSVGGTEMYVHTLGKELQTLGCDVTIAAPSIDEKERNYTYDGLPVYRYPVSMNPTRSEVRGEAPPEYFDVFTNWVNQTKPDIVHIHSFTRGCGFFHAQYVKQLGIPLVFTVHVPDFTCARGTMMRWGKVPCDGEIYINRCAACYLQGRGIPRLLTSALNVLPIWVINRFNNVTNRLGTALQMRKLIAARKERIRQLFNLSDKIVAVSQWLYDVLRINGVPDSKLSLSRHGLPSSYFNPQPQPCPFRVGYIGRFNPVKGVHILIKAVKRLPSAIPIQLRLFGRVNDEEDKAYFEKLKKIVGKDNRIIFCGEVTDKNRQEILSNLDILAVPSLWLEAGPFVVLEAFAAGIPVIGSNLGGIVELVTNGVNGLLVEAGDIKAWTDALEKICLQPMLLKDMVARIPSVRTTNDVSNEMLTIYREILNQKQY